MKKETDELSELSGENQIKSPPEYKVPIIRFNGKDGGFTKISKNEKGEKEEQSLGESFKAIMLKFRRSYSAFTDTSSMFTNEHDPNSKIINIFERKETKKGWKVQLIDSGTISEMRDKYQNLKMVQSIYLLFEEQVVKLQVKGKGLGYLFDYWREFNSEEHTFQFETEFGQQEETSRLGKYYAMTFTRSDKVEDLTEVAVKIKEVADAINRIEDFYANYKPIQEIISETEIKEPEKEGIELPTIREGEEEENIDVKDIPF